MQRLALLLLLSAISTPAAAIPFTWVASGTVYSFNNHFGLLSLPPAVDGDPFAYEFTYDPAGRVDQDPSALRGRYLGGLIAASLTVGGQTMQLAVPPTAVTRVDVEVRPSSVLSFYTSTTEEPAPGSFEFALQFDNIDYVGIPSTDAIPVTPPDLAVIGFPWFTLFSYNRYLSNHEDFPDASFWGVVTSLTLKNSTVPEPATVALFALGLSGIFFGRRRSS